MGVNPNATMTARLVFNPGAAFSSLTGDAADVAIPRLERADESGKLGITHFACGNLQIEPGPPPLALFGPALAALADLEEKDPDLDESAITEFTLDITIGADSVGQNLAFDARFLPRLAGRRLAILEVVSTSSLWV